MYNLQVCTIGMHSIQLVYTGVITINWYT